MARLPRRPLVLTPEHVARVERVEMDPGPEPGTEEYSESEYYEVADALLARHRPRDLWVFAYGSLIWNPTFETVESRRAIAYGWRRSFCLKLTRWRGTRETPALMLALDRGGSCTGVAYRLPGSDHRKHLFDIAWRELDDKPSTNLPRWITVHTAQGPLMALAVVAARGGRSYQGGLPTADVAAILARSAGHSGSSTEYLYRTVTTLAQHGIYDSHLWDLQELVAREIDAMGNPAPDLPGL